MRITDLPSTPSRFLRPANDTLGIPVRDHIDLVLRHAVNVTEQRGGVGARDRRGVRKGAGDFMPNFAALEGDGSPRTV